MYTVDASVWVNGFDEREPGHEASRRMLEHLATEAIPIVLPHLALVEVAGAISRTRRDPAQAQAFALAIRRLPNVRLVPLDDELTDLALALAAQHGLRGADAVYAAVARSERCTLISWDHEHLTRLGSVATTLTPAQVLDSLAPSP